MPLRPFFLTLPKQLRQQLEQRVRATAYGSVGQHCEWLGKQGHPIGRTAVWRYATRLRTEDAEAAARSATARSASDLRLAELRLGCLQAACESGVRGAVIVRRAASYMRWVLDGDAQPAGAAQASLRRSRTIP